MEKLLQGDLCAVKREFRLQSTDNEDLKLKSFVQKQDMGTLNQDSSKYAATEWA